MDNTKRITVIVVGRTHTGRFSAAVAGFPANRVFKTARGAQREAQRLALMPNRGMVEIRDFTQAAK